MGNNPSNTKGADMPVTNVSFHDVQEFCKKMTKLSDEFEYRLPTEDEWEHCCQGDPDELGEYAWYYGNCNGLQEVGKKKSNTFGLHDMLGLVWEWCDSDY